MGLKNSRKALAKSNLKKSIYISSGMAVLVGAIGIGISIPVYNSIKAGLKASSANLFDLSSKMSELVAKLGISPDESFEKELSGGFVVVFSHGQTRILKTINGKKTLVMNLNEDHSVGSAAMKSGAAAQAMLSVITEASSTFGEESSALADVMSEFSEEAEVESLETEAAMTGFSITDLKVRNALSDPDSASVALALAKIKVDGGLTDQQINDAKLNADKVIKKRKAAEAARVKLIHDLLIAKQKGAAALLIEQKRQESIKAVAEKKRLAAQVIIKAAQILRYKTWITANHKEVVFPTPETLE